MKIVHQIFILNHSEVVWQSYIKKHITFHWGKNDWTITNVSFLFERFLTYTYLFIYIKEFISKPIGWR